MKPSLEEYCREVDERAAQFAETETDCRRDDHLQAFNFGRMIQRTEDKQRGGWFRAGWLLTGLVLGILCGMAIPNHLPNTLIHRFLSQANLLGHKARNSTLGKVWAPPRIRV